MPGPRLGSAPPMPSSRIDRVTPSRYPERALTKTDATNAETSPDPSPTISSKILGHCLKGRPDLVLHEARY
jgi:hypothetical protein